MNPGNYLTVSAQQKVILEGFLGYLSGLIAGSDVKLDPSDPKTYGQLLYKNLHSSSEERVGRLNSVQNDRDVAQIHEKDMNDIQQKLEKLQAEMKRMEQSRITLMKAIETSEQKLKQAKTAIEKRDFWKEIQETKAQMNLLTNEVLLFKTVRETAEKKQEILALIKNDHNLVHFYNTVEHRLQSLFIGVFAAQSELMTPELGSTTGKIQTAIDWIPESVRNCQLRIFTL
ncbi:unnamed protein product [Didymodactylos carnosus]|uniref:Uncharacterized protein n=1 Tax=Didymodactylos carnosus TaxID=1234261 RepID=A0A814TQ86_9BILA|nr:unnamed protein product [Didymodactylos carnosus]CAF3927960.1 unnamed protein product [Didymodactylos carnosus]